jgi:trimeric autotransporter adhesin
MAFASDLTIPSGYGSPYLDSLIWGCQWSNSSTSLVNGSSSSPMIISYSYGSGTFTPGLAVQGEGINQGFGHAWTNSEISAVDLALQKIASVCNISFSKSGYSSNEGSQTNIVFYKETEYQQQAGYAGMAEVPDGSSGLNGSYNIYFNSALSLWANLTAGSDAFNTVIHEVGHGLGLAHPHDGGGGLNPTNFPGVTSSSDLGEFVMNQGIWTVMSYNWDWKDQPAPADLSYGGPTGLMALDIAALQRIYGANTNFATTDNTYSLPTSNTLGTGWTSIWDAGGNDTISNVGSSLACVINLNAAELIGQNAGGYVSWNSGGAIVGGYTIANGVVIEKALGGSGADTLIGNSSNNLIDGGSGNDTIDGSGGLDTVLFSGSRSSYAITYDSANTAYIVRNLVNSSDTDSIKNVEYFSFSDATFGSQQLLTLPTQSPDNLSAPTADNWIVNGLAGNDTLTGGAGNDNINGGADNDTLSGIVGNDTLDGGTGIDTLSGGTGNDTYFVDNASDVIIENASDNTPSQELFSMGNNNDVVVASTTYTLTANASGIEDVMAAGSLTGNAGLDTTVIHLTGNASAQALIGNSAANSLSGLAGDDILVGMGGADTLTGGEGSDTLLGGLGNDTLNGDAGNDVFIFNQGSSSGSNLLNQAFTFDATGGADVFNGGTGENTLYMRGSLADYNITRTSGTEYAISVKSGSTVFSSETATFSNIQKLAFGGLESDAAILANLAAAINLSSLVIPSAFADNLSAPSADNWIVNGLAGADTLTGGAGNDSINGGADNDTIAGNVGNDTLDGGAGIDTLSGGTGNDTYFVDNAGDVIDESGIREPSQELFSMGNNNDVVVASTTYTLTANASGIEDVMAAGSLTGNAGLDTTVIHLTGNASAQALIGNSAANSLSGLAGDDILVGMGGADTLTGGEGSDTLLGGLGNDTLNGDAGNDVFIFNQGSSSGSNLLNQAFTFDATGGADVFNGGTGENTLYMRGSLADYNITRTSGTEYAISVKSGSTVFSSETATFSNIQKLAFGGLESDAAILANLAAAINLSSLVIPSAFADNLSAPSADNWIVNGLAGADTLTGGAGNDSINGGADNDTIAGNVGNDTLDGGAGIDTLSGGTGNDTYFVDNAGDVIDESGIREPSQELFSMGNNNDVVVASTTYTLTANASGIEDVMAAGSLTGNAGLDTTVIHLTGNASAQALIGNSAANSLSGLAGDDILVGMGGADTLTGGEGSDTLLGGLGNDTLNGDAGNDVFIFNQGSSSGSNLLNQAFTFDATGGADVFNGGTGENTLYMRGSLADYNITRTSGTEYAISVKSGSTVFSSETATFSNIQKLAFGGLESDAATQTNVANAINLSSLTIASEGADVLSAPSSAPWVFFGGGGNDTLTGGAGNDTIDGGADNDTITGGPGINTLIGGTGNDTFVVNYATGPTAFNGAPSFVPGAPNAFTNVITDAGGTDTLSITFNDPGSFNPDYFFNLRRSGVDGADFAVGIRPGNNSSSDLDAWFGQTTIMGQYRFTSGTYANVIEGGTISGNTVIGTETGNLAFGAGSNLLTLFGSTGNDYVAAWGSRNTLVGLAGDDHLIGSRLDTQDELNTYNARHNLTGDSRVTHANVHSKSAAGALVGDSLLGGAGSDTLNGYYGNDYLDGGAGADVLMGWDGNDTYIVDNALDVIEEHYGTTASPTNGIDTIITSLTSLDLRDVKYFGVENLSAATVTTTTAGVSTQVVQSAGVTFIGSSANNIITGGTGNDTLNGGAGNDTLFGGAGNDWLEFTDDRGTPVGIDTLVGGVGNDTYVADIAGANIIELADQGTDTVITQLASYTLENNVENLTHDYFTPTGPSQIPVTYRDFVGTGNAQNNVITAFGGNDTLYGLAGSDTLLGDAGSDTLFGGIGNDTLDGGAGTDTAMFAGTRNDYAVAIVGTGANAVITVTGLGAFAASEGVDTIRQGVEFIRFSNDSVNYIDAATSFARGVIMTAAIGNPGNDSLRGSDGDDLVNLGSGNDTYWALGGNDIVYGEADNDTIDGGVGNDTLSGGSGDDTFIGGRGADSIDGGAGDDVAFYVTPNAAPSAQDPNVLDPTTVGISLVSTANNTFTVTTTITGGTVVDTLTAIESVVATARDDALNASNATQGVELVGLAGNDTLTGSSSADILVGGSGNDTLDGRAGADTLLGGVGNDVYIVDSVNDFVKDSVTHVDYANNFAPVIDPSWFRSDPDSIGFVNDPQDPNWAINPQLLAGGIDTVRTSLATYSLVQQTNGNAGLHGDIENLEYTGTANFIGTGNALNNTITGNTGNDVLDGARGRDTLIGGNGNDLYKVYSSADRVTETGATAAAGGIDTINSTTSRVLDANVENLNLVYTNASSSGYTVIGNATDNTITGGSATDRLYGRDGNDVLNGAGGHDFLYGGNGDDRLTGGDGNDALYGGAGTDTLNGGTGNDILDGGAGINTLIGGAGNDVYQINSATNTIVENTNEGSDVLAINFAGTFTSYDMTVNAAQVEEAYVTGSLFTASSLTGNALNNIIEGNMAANTINGGAGNDTIWGDGDNPLSPDITGSNDSLLGGAGNDTLYGQGGDDVLDGGTGNDTMTGGIGNDTYFVDSSDDFAIDLADPLTGGVDWIVGTTDIDLYWRPNQYVGIEHVRLDGMSSSNIWGNDQTNVLLGNDGHNWIAAHGGNDRISAGAGHDDTAVGKGNNWLDGGAGIDFVSYGQFIINEFLAPHRESVYGYDLLTGLNTNPINLTTVGIRANLDITAQLGIAASTVIRSSAVSAGVDTVLNTEGILGTNFNDTLVGGAESNLFAGGRGNDTLVGGSGTGSDLLVLGAGTAYGLTVDMTALGIDFANQQTAATLKVLNLASLSTVNNAFADGSRNHTQDVFNGARDLTVTDSSITTTARITNGGNGLGTVTYWGMEGLGLSGLSDTAYGTAGNDTIWGLEGTDLIFGGDGNDVLVGDVNIELALAYPDNRPDFAGRDTLYGGNGNDTLVAGSSNSTLFGETGDDLLNGLFGNDTLFGGDGLDRLDGGDGDDLLNGGAGNDTVTGGAGIDTLIGGGGTDVLIGGAGDDEYLYTGSETLTELANGGIDKVLVFAGNTPNTFTLADNFEWAALGNSGSVGDDINVFTNVTTLVGNSANNLLLGNIDDNVMNGGAGNDTLSGYGGDDLLIGGLGTDLFVLNLSPNQDQQSDRVSGFGGQITDFNRSGANEGDKLLLNFKAMNGSSSVDYAYSFNGGTSFGNTAQDAPRATLTYDASTGLLEMQFQQSDGNGGWAFSSADSTPDISYLITGTSDSAAAVLNANSFLVDTSIDTTHPMQRDNYWGQQA